VPGSRFSIESFREAFGDPECRKALWGRVEETVDSVCKNPGQRAEILEKLKYLDRLRKRFAAERLGIPPTPQVPEPLPGAAKALAEAVKRKGKHGKKLKGDSARRYARRHLIKPPDTFSQWEVVYRASRFVWEVTGKLPSYERLRAIEQRELHPREKEEILQGPGLDFLVAVLDWATYPFMERVGKEQIVKWLKPLRRWARNHFDFDPTLEPPVVLTLSAGWQHYAQPPKRVRRLRFSPISARPIFPPNHS
jgi:hypothetical protein